MRILLELKTDVKGLVEKSLSYTLSCKDNWKQGQISIIYDKPKAWTSAGGEKKKEEK